MSSHHEQDDFQLSPSEYLQVRNWGKTCDVIRTPPEKRFVLCFCLCFFFFHFLCLISFELGQRRDTAGRKSMLLHHPGFKFAFKFVRKANCYTKVHQPFHAYMFPVSNSAEADNIPDSCFCEVYHTSCNHILVILRGCAYSLLVTSTNS